LAHGKQQAGHAHTGTQFNSGTRVELLFQFSYSESRNGSQRNTTPFKIFRVKRSAR